MENIKLITVGQLVKELSLILKKHPECSDWDVWKHENSFTGAIKWKGLLILETDEDSQNPELEMQDLLEELKKHEDSTKVVFRCGWRLVNFLPLKGNSFFIYDDDRCCFDYD